MKRSQTAWTIIFALAVGWILFRAATDGVGRVWVRTTEFNAVEHVDQQIAKIDAEERIARADGREPDVELIAKRTALQSRLQTVQGMTWNVRSNVEPRRGNEPDVDVSRARTVGVWVAALATLCILSFLIGDNPGYKIAEATFIGVSAAYMMVVQFWTGIVQNLFGKLVPGMMRESLLPGLSADTQPNWYYVVPFIFSVMMLLRLIPKTAWVSRWPMAFFIGATAGVRLVGYLQGDFVEQIRNTIIPLVAYTGGEFDLKGTLTNLGVVIGVFTSLIYFFFSIEHKGVMGGIARVGIWTLMITFGAGFGFTVMNRIALISERLTFLFDDWLWLIDPLGQRVGM